MSKTGRYSAVQVRANPPGRAKLASKLASQSQPERASEDYTSHLSAATGESQNINFYFKHTHTICLDNKSWEVLSDQWFLFIKRDELSRHLCGAIFMWLLHDFSYGPPLAGSWSPLCHPIKKILESPLLCVKVNLIFQHLWFVRFTNKTLLVHILFIYLFILL